MEGQRSDNLETKVEKAADDLQLNLPGSNLPPVIRFIVLFMLAGGVSIIGSVFADIANPNQLNAAFYVLRIVVGVLVITTAYELIKMSRLALWFYGVAIAIGLAVNPLVTILPLAVLVYLIFEKDKLSPSILDYKTEEITRSVFKIFKKDPPPPPSNVPKDPQLT